MAIPIKSPNDLAALRRSGRLAWDALGAAVDAVRPGARTRDLDAVVRSWLREAGAEPVMLGFARGDAPLFPACSSICVNEEVAHGVPGDRVLRPGDVVTLDVALRFEGWCADAARAVVVGGSPGGEAPSARDRFERSGRLVAAAGACVDAAIAVLAPGRPWSFVARAAEDAARAAGVRLVPGYDGHGLGRELHEPPAAPIPMPASGPGRAGVQDFILRPGMVLTIEPIVLEPPASGGRQEPELVGTDDGWTVLARDRSRACHEERTVAVARGGPVVLTAPEQDRRSARPNMPKQQDEKFTFEAVVTEALPNAMFKVRLPNEQKTEVLAYVSGKMRMNYIRILPGDRVTVEMSPYDLTKARITYRH